MLRTISNIRDISVDVEANVRDVVERYRLLAVYNLLVRLRFCLYPLSGWRQCRRRPAILPLQLWQGCQVCVKISAQRLPRVAQFNAC